MYNQIIQTLVPVQKIICPFWGQIAGAIGGSLVSGLFSKSSAKQQTSAQLNASSTSHQREVEDLKAAGLNPILSAGGSGAPGISGAGYSMPDIGNTISSAANSAKQLELLDAEKRKLTTSSWKDVQDVDLSTTTERKTIAEMDYVKQQTQNAAKQGNLLEAQEAKARVEEKLYESAFGALINLAEKFGVNLNSAKSIIPKKGKKGMNKPYYDPQIKRKGVPK